MTWPGRITLTITFCMVGSNLPRRGDHSEFPVSHILRPFRYPDRIFWILPRGKNKFWIFCLNVKLFILIFDMKAGILQYPFLSEELNVGADHLSYQHGQVVV